VPPLSEFSARPPKCRQSHDSFPGDDVVGEKKGVRAVRAILRRLAFYLLAAWSAVTLNFFLPRMLPGSALQAVLSSMRSAPITPAQLKALEAEYGAGNNSLLSQYASYIGNLLRGDLGTSTSKSVPVTDILSSDLPWTVGLVGTATVIAFVLGTFLGVIAGWRRGGLLDTLLPVATFFQAIPYYILAFLLLMTMGYLWQWFPLAGGYDISRDSTVEPGWNGGFISSVAYHGVLPAATIVLASIAGWILGMRNVTITTMDEDYVLVAAAKGLPRWRVIWVAARNAILPQISSLALSVSLIVTGSIVTEIVFSYPGLGLAINNATLDADYPLMQGILLCVTFAVLAVNFLADIVYVILDPRARREA
jgi:peptide/nickel transport system permease protein